MIGYLDMTQESVASWPLALLLLVAGVAALLWGGHLLVEGAVAIARRLGMPALLIGLTIVAFGTSAPELALNTVAAANGETGLAFGNVIGSNMFNLLAIIGIATFVGPITVDPAFLRVDLWVMLGASLVLVPFVFFKKDITRTWGIILSAIYVVYLVQLF